MCNSASLSGIVIAVIYTHFTSSGKLNAVVIGSKTHSGFRIQMQCLAAQLDATVGIRNKT